ncbi:putative tail tubular protein [uncultured Mediterranean phage uvDeep-CGR2-AD3-C191]|nr:putative tail tubular protein [uncultured Mediterranean phage uvDeep-CGR2-AD3-C191]
MADKSEVAICSNALRLLGDEPITSLTDNSDRARLCNSLYEPTRDSVLRNHPWNFALTRTTLEAVDSTSPAWGYSNQFTLPTDPYCLRVWELDKSDIDFKIEGRKLLTDEANVNFLYIAVVTDPNTFDALFYEALIFRMASNLAYPITGSRESGETYFTLFQERLKEARLIDSQERGYPRLLDSTTLTEVR